MALSARLNEAATAQGSRPAHGGGIRRCTADLTFTDGVAEAELTVPDARFWSDTDPYLYDLTDRHRQRPLFAARSASAPIEVQGSQILLNGQPVQLNGFGRHEDFIASGKGLNLPLLVKDYQLMRWTGANSYRTSHYPYSEEEMQLADREGFLIIDEIPAVSLQFDTEANMAERLRMCLQQIDELIARDKNHPSVVMWCVANEPMPRNSEPGRGGGDRTNRRSRRSARQGLPRNAAAPRPGARSHAPGHDRDADGRPDLVDGAVRCRLHEPLLGLVCAGRPAGQGVRRRWSRSSTACGSSGTSRSS